MTPERAPYRTHKTNESKTERSLLFMKNVFDFLDEKGISYEVYDHPAVFTVEEARQHRIEVDFGENKNLFLRNRKGNKHYLVTIDASKQLDLKKIAEQMGEKSVGFASEERLAQYLGLTKGSVSPFGLINDTEKHVVFIMDNDLLKHEKLGFHPNINTQTVVLETSEFRKFLDTRENEVIFMDIV